MAIGPLDGYEYWRVGLSDIIPDANFAAHIRAKLFMGAPPTDEASQDRFMSSLLDLLTTDRVISSAEGYVTFYDHALDAARKRYEQRGQYCDLDTLKRRMPDALATAVLKTAFKPSRPVPKPLLEDVLDNAMSRKLRSVKPSRLPAKLIGSTQGVCNNVKDPNFSSLDNVLIAEEEAAESRVCFAAGSLLCVLSEGMISVCGDEVALVDAAERYLEKFQQLSAAKAKKLRREEGVSLPDFKKLQKSVPILRRILEFDPALMQNFGSVSDATFAAATEPEKKILCLWSQAKSEAVAAAFGIRNGTEACEKIRDAVRTLLRLSKDCRKLVREVFQARQQLRSQLEDHLAERSKARDHPSQAQVNVMQTRLDHMSRLFTIVRREELLEVLSIDDPDDDHQQ